MMYHIVTSYDQPIGKDVPAGSVILNVAKNRLFVIIGGSAKATESLNDLLIDNPKQ